MEYNIGCVFYRKGVPFGQVHYLLGSSVIPDDKKYWKYGVSFGAGKNLILPAEEIDRWLCEFYEEFEEMRCE